MLINATHFYNLPNGDQMKKYDEIRKIVRGQGHDYTTGCLLQYQYFKDQYKLLVLDLSKQKKLDTDPRAIQQTEFYGMLKTNSEVCTILEKKKRNSIRILQRSSNSFVNIINGGIK